MRKPIAAALAILAIALALFCVLPSSHLRREPNFQLVFKTITSIIRAPLSSVLARNDTILVGDLYGGLNVWVFNEKKKKLEYQDTSRTIVPVLPSPNQVIHLDSLPEAAVALTADGKLTVYPINAQSKITGKVDIISQSTFSDFRLLKQEEQTYLLTISGDKKNLCLYRINESLLRPNPIAKVTCLPSTSEISGLAYDEVNSLVAVGDETKAKFYQLNLTKESLSSLCEANLPKAETKGFDSEFSNGTLVAVNNLWVTSIVIDLSVPSAKVLSSDRTEKILTKTGVTSVVAVNNNDKRKETRVIANAKNIVKGYSLSKVSKLTFQNDSRSIGEAYHFSLNDENTLFATSDIYLEGLKVGDSSEKDYLASIDSQPIDSLNHFQKVNKIGHWNGTIVSVSDGGKLNFKLWKLTDYSLSLVDEKTISYFSILKSGYNGLTSLVLLPPVSKANANNTLHILTAGDNPFEVVLVSINTQGKIGTVSKSKDSHSNNITALFITPDFKTIVSASMDSYIRVWQLSANRETIADNSTLVVTKYGPIKVGLQSKTGEYYVFGHCNTNISALVNITVWKTDEKKGMVKVAENTPSEAHESNLTAMLFSNDQKYIITLSESGQLRLWQHKDFTMIDLLASLSIGIFDLSLTITDSDKLLLQSAKEFIEYSFDYNGFILEGRQSKQYVTTPSTMLTVGDKVLSGDGDGSIRVYQHSD